MGKAKLNIPMLTALILLLLTMITTHMTSGLYARYSTTASNSANARVASFDVDYTVVKTDDGSYSLTVHNRSEVAVEYFIDVEMHPNLSATIGDRTKSPTEGESSVRFSHESWKLAPDSESQPISMTFSVTDWSGLSESGKTVKTEETVTLGFKVKVTAEQLD